jgi:hypothetical protein
MIRLGIGPAGIHLLTVQGDKKGAATHHPVYLIAHQGSRAALYRRV